MIRYSLIFFFLLKLLQIHLQTPSYLMQQRIILYHRTDLKKVFFSFLFFFFFEYFCYIFISVTFLPYPNVAFFLTIYSFSFNSQVSFYLFANIIFLHSLFVYTQVSLQYLRHPPDDCNFCFIYLYVQYSYKKFKKILIATYLRLLKRFHFF